MENIIGLSIFGLLALCGLIVVAYAVITVAFLVRRNKSGMRGHEVAKNLLDTAGVNAIVFGSFIVFPFWNYSRRRKSLKLQRIVTYNGKSLYAMNSAAEQAYCGFLTDSKSGKRWTVRLGGIGASFLLLAGIVCATIGAISINADIDNGDAVGTVTLALGLGGFAAIIFAFVWVIAGQMILKNGISTFLKDSVTDEADYKSIMFYQKLKVITAVAILILKVLSMILKIFEKFSKNKASE